MRLAALIWSQTEHDAIPVRAKRYNSAVGMTQLRSVLQTPK
jgi:hypothetical protein